MKISWLLSKLKLKFSDSLEEDDYHKIKQPLLREFFNWLLGCGACAMLILIIYFFINQRYVEGGITIFMLLAAISTVFTKKFINRFMEYTVVGYLIVVVILVVVAFNKSIIDVDNNRSFYAGYTFALFNRILGYRIVELHSMILFHLISIALRFALLQTSDPLIIVISILMEIFTIYLSVKSEKGERQLFDSLYKSKENLIKFRDFLIAHMPHPMVIFDNTYSSLQLVNDAFKQSFKFEDAFELKCCLKKLIICFEFLTKYKAMVAEVGVTDEQIGKLTLSEFLWMISQKMSFLRDKKVLTFRVFEPKTEPTPPPPGLFMYEDESSQDDIPKPKISNSNHKFNTETKPLNRYNASRSTMMKESYHDNREPLESPCGILFKKDKRKQSDDTNMFVCNRNVDKGKLVVGGTGVKRILECKLFLLEWDGEETIVVMLEDTAKRELMTITNNSLANVMSSPALKIPLMNILSRADSFAKKISDSDQSLIPELKTWESNVKILLSLTSSLLEATQSKQPGLRSLYSHVSVKGLIQEVNAIFEPLCRIKGIFFKVENSSDLPESITIDKSRLSLILVNVLAGSLGATVKGGITLGLSLEKQGTKHLRFTVEDTCKGLSKEKQSELLHVVKQKELYGSGINGDSMNLGLVVSNILLDALNYINEQGLQFISEQDKGNTVSFVVPCQPVGPLSEDVMAKEVSITDIIRDFVEDYQIDQGDEEEGLPAQNRRAACLSSINDTRLLFEKRTSDVRSTFELANFNDRQPWCLVVDDIAFNVMSAKSSLERKGYRVKIAMNGKDALEQALQHEKEGQVFKAILIDGEMPLMDGYETAKELKALMKAKEIVECPIIGMLEEDKSKSSGSKMREAVMKGYIKKPVDPDELENALEKI